jgi:hypothetical protein
MTKTKEELKAVVGEVESDRAEHEASFELLKKKLIAEGEAV